VTTQRINDVGGGGTIPRTSHPCVCRALALPGSDGDAAARSELKVLDHCPASAGLSIYEALPIAPEPEPRRVRSWVERFVTAIKCFIMNSQLDAGSAKGAIDCHYMKSNPVFWGHCGISQAVAASKCQIAERGCEHVGPKSYSQHDVVTATNGLYNYASIVSITLKVGDITSATVPE